MDMRNFLREFNFPLPLISRLRLKENHLHQVYVAVAMRDFAATMVGVFEPIYFYQIFKEVTSISPLSLVSLYYALFFLSFGILSPLGARLAGSVGFRWMALLAVPFRFFYYIILILVPTFPWLIPVALLCFILAAVLYWPAFHFLFAHISRRETRATSVGFMHISGALASAAGPAIGGIILIIFGYPALFMGVLLLLIFSVLPFWFSPNIQEGYRDSIRKSLQKMFKRSAWRPVLSFAASGVEDQANGVLWPLFLFLLAISYSSLGFIISLSLAITLVVTYFAGRLSDKIGWMRVLSAGIVLHVFAWFSRILVTNVPSAFISHGYYGMTRALVATPFAAIFYDDVAFARVGESYGAIILREQALNVGRALFLALVALWFFASDNFAIVFIIAGLATFAKRVVRKE